MIHRWGAAADRRWSAQPFRRGVPIPPEVFLAHGRTATLRYLDTAPDDATRPLVVLLADPPVTIESYSDLIGRLRDSHRVVVTELPGFGFSTPLPGYDFTLTALGDALTEFIATLSDTHTTLVAPCATAYCALDIATRQPALLHRLVLTQAPDWPTALFWRDRLDRASKGILRTPLLGQLLLRAVRTNLGGQWLRRACATPDTRARLLADFAAADRTGAAFSLATAFQHYLAGPAPRIDTATDILALWGDADPSHRHSDPETITRIAPAARLVRLPDTGHFPELERPDILAALLR